MQKYTILFLILLVFTCRHKKIKKLWEFPTKPNSEAFFFSYGVKATTDKEVNTDIPPSWGPSLKSTDTTICINSHDDFFRSKEYGPTLGFCIEKTDDNETLLKSALETLNDLDETKVRPDGFLVDDGTKAHTYFLSLTEIVNEISASGSRIFFLGDNRLHTAIEKRMDLSFENYKSIQGNKDHRIETSFSLPYFSIYAIDGIYKLIFPPLESGIPRSQYHYLVFELSNFPEFISAFQSVFTRLQSINDTWRTSCSREKLEITEVMGYSGSTKRFIEWTGSKENSNCIEKISLSIAGKQINLDTNSPFLFPGAIKLFIEENSLLQGIVLKDANWKEIKSSANIQLAAYDFKDSWDLPENVNFNWAEEEFSLKRKINTCEWSSSIIRNANLCSDPGLEMDTDSILGISTANNQCKPEDFKLTELNAYGLRSETKIDRTGKFLEIVYTGQNECKPQFLSIQIGTTNVPLTFGNQKLKPDSIWVISDGRQLTGVTNLIRRNLDFMQWQHSITLQNSTSKKILWKGLSSDENFLSESMNGNIFSMVLVDDKIFHHPPQKPNRLQAVFRVSHQMSPGETNIDLLQDVNGELSEVLWAGGYKNSVSLLEEKFIELKTIGDGTLELEVVVNAKTTRFYLPISRIDAFTVLSKSSLQCFPNARSIISDKLTLSDDITTIRIKSDGKQLSELKYYPQRGEGTNDTTNKIRASFVNTSTKFLWKSSTKTNRSPISSECQTQVYATPDALNEFEPFLADEIFEYIANGKFYLAASIFDQSLTYSVRLYSYLPLEEELLPLEKLGFENLLKTVSSLLSTSGLIYQRLETYTDLKLYNRDGIFIEGIMTNPSNPQNEWILFCNRGKFPKDLSVYEIQDEDSVDQIDSYFKRKNLSLPSGVSAPNFIGNSTILNSGQCAYLIDPESSQLNLKSFGIAPTLVLTVRTSSTIGNGISSGEALDLFKYNGSERIHVHSFGNRYSHAPFTLPVTTDEIILLQNGKRGEGKYDYEVLKW